MAVYAPDSKKSLETYEECIPSVVQVLQEGRKGGARDLFSTGDFNVEKGLMCSDDHGNEELTKMYGPLCSQGYEKDPPFFKKIMWYGIMKEIGCKVYSTWSECGKGRAEAFTHRHLSQDKIEEISQVNHIVGPMKRNDEIYIRKTGRLPTT